MNDSPIHLTDDEIQNLKKQLMIKELLLDSGTDGIGISENGILLFVNNQIVKMLGFDSPNEMIGQPISRFVAPQSQELVAKKLVEDVTKPYESFFRRKNGTEFPGLTFARQADFMGKKVRIATVRNNTKVHNSEKMLETSERRYKSLFNQIPTTIWEEDASDLVKYTKELGLENIEDLNGYLINNLDIVAEALSRLHVLNMNETALNLLQVKDRETLINSFPQFFTHEALLKFRKSIIAFVNKKKYFEMESEFIKTNGEIIDIQVIWSVIPGYEDTYSKVITVITDITSRKKAELERNEMESRFEHMQKLESLGTFASGIAHDFNNLLVGILGNVSLAINQLDHSSPVVDILKEIEEISNKASNLTRQLQAYSGKGKTSKVLFNLNDLIEEMQGFIKITIPSSVKIATDLSKTEPWVEADRVQVRQIIINLLTNASESMTNKGIISLKTYHITKETLDDHLGLMILHPKDSAFYTCLEISDTGIGIEDSIKRKIFDPFYTNTPKGKGLGLSVVHGIIKGHEGGLILETKLNEGASFKILFPLFIDYKSLQDYEKTEIKDSNFIPEGKIMVIDDEPVVLSIACKLLKKIGFDPISAIDGHEAINVFQENSDIKLVIVDLTMEKITAKETYLELRKFNPKLPIVISSGFSRNEVFQQFEGVERLEFLQKPYSIEELKNIILLLI